MSVLASCLDVHPIKQEEWVDRTVTIVVLTSLVENIIVLGSKGVPFIFAHFFQGFFTRLEQNRNGGCEE